MFFEDLLKCPRAKLGVNESFVLFSQSVDELDAELWNYYLGFLPIEFSNKISNYKKWQDKQNALLGKLLVYIGFYIVTGEKLSFKNYQTNFYGKPFISGSKINFNISHSGNTVVCAFDVQNIGIDIEEVRYVDLEAFDCVFSDEEMQTIIREGVVTFYKFWTIKEAVSKAIGKGLSVPFLDIKIIEECAVFGGRKWYLKNFILGNKYCTISTEVPNASIKYMEVKF